MIGNIDRTLVVILYSMKIGIARRYRILDAPCTAPPPFFTTAV